MSRPTVGINLLWLVPGDVGGSEESTVASLRALAAVPDLDLDLDLRLFVLDAFATAHPDVVAAWPTEVCSRSGRSRVGRIVLESTWLAARTRGLALVHHAGGTAPAVRTALYVLTVHDVQPLEHSVSHGSVKRAYLGLAIPRSVRRARAVVVPSEFVRRTLVAHTGIDPGRVVVVPHGVDVSGPATSEDDLRRRYDLPGAVVLYPAITYPHKNHATLVAAFAGVLREHPDATLVLTGRPDAAEPALVEQISTLGLGDRVRRLGRVPAADVAGLYALATVVAVPSQYEGFGLPAVEAMAHGVPVVAARATALEEVVADAGVLVAPDDVAGWRAALVDLLSAPDRRAELVAAGRVRAAGFTWAANAAALARVYREAVNGPDA